MRKVDIFGLKDYAELSHYYLTHHSNDAVVMFEDAEAWGVCKCNRAEKLAIPSTKMRF